MSEDNMNCFVLFLHVYDPNSEKRNLWNCNCEKWQGRFVDTKKYVVFVRMP